MNKNRTPVVIAAADIESGVTSWALRFRAACRDHPRFDVSVINCWRTGKRVGEFDAEILHESAMRDYLLQRPGAIVVPNFVWELFPLCAELVRKGGRYHTFGYVHANSEPEYYAPCRWLDPLIGSYLAASADIAAHLSEMLPARAENIRVLPCGVDVPDVLERTWQTAPLRLVYGGRIVAHIKRVLDFVPLVENLLALGTDFTFTILGAGPQREELRQRIDALSHGGRVRFVDSLPVFAMAQVWREHDIFLQVSESEGTSCSMLEAMAQGCVPCVTNASSGVRDVVNSGRDGVIVPVRDMGALAQAVHALSQNPDELARMGTAAHRASTRFGMPPYVKEFASAAESLLAGEPRSWQDSDTRRRQYNLGGGKGTSLGSQHRFLKRSVLHRVLARLYRG